ncbi:MAG TPA: helicase-related protein, partial [Candidatus Omnitrophota bacterium]|nr:helicase-related protein [Candidatus Omnitrophota bacterium]
MDPEISVRPSSGQIQDIVSEVEKRAAKDERVLVTTITKRLAEELTEYLKGKKLRVRYLHSEINALDRIEIIRDLRLGKFDCLVGINLLREGIDLPEVSLVAVLDADKEGFLRSDTSLIQVAGRAARNVNGQVIFYADTVTDSMRRTIDITRARREKQYRYNLENDIKPRTVKKAIAEGIEAYKKAREIVEGVTGRSGRDYDSLAVLSELERDMEQAARNLQFEKAIEYRNQIEKLKKTIKQEVTDL